MEIQGPAAVVVHFVAGEVCCYAFFRSCPELLPTKHYGAGQPMVSNIKALGSGYHPSSHVPRKWFTLWLSRFGTMRVPEKTIPCRFVVGQIAALFVCRLVGVRACVLVFFQLFPMRRERMWPCPASFFRALHLYCTAASSTLSRRSLNLQKSFHKSKSPLFLSIQDVLSRTFSKKTTTNQQENVSKVVSKKQSICPVGEQEAVYLI